MVRNIKKLSVLFLIIIFLVTLSSCTKKIEDYGEMDRIVYRSILTQKADNYLVFVYANECRYCEELKPLLCEYATKAKKNNKYMPFFVVNADNKRSNNGLVKNDDEYNDFTNTTDYTEIHIATTPALIIVKNGSVSNFISSKKTQTPASEIRSYIQNLM